MVPDGANGSYMQNSAAIDERAFEEDDEEDKVGVCYDVGSPIFRNRIINTEENPQKKPTRSTI